MLKPCYRTLLDGGIKAKPLGKLGKMKATTAKAAAATVDCGELEKRPKRPTE